MNSRPRILLYTHEYPPFKGGAGEYCSQMAAALSLKGCSVTVASPDDSVSETVFEIGPGPRVIRYRRKTPLRNAWFLLWLTLRYRIGHVIIGDAGAISDFLVVPPPSVHYSIVAHGTEILNTFHPQVSTINSANQRRMRGFFSQAFSIIHSSFATLGCMKDCNLKVSRPVRVYPAVDLSSVPSPSQRQIEIIKKRYDIDDEAVILNVARFGVDKGQDVLLRAYSRIRDRFPNTKLILVGSGPMRERSIELAYDLGLDDSVIFPGQISSEEISAHHALSTFFVMVSRSVERFESFGIVYLEAALCRRASIAGNHGGVPEAVSDGVTGIVVDPEDIDAIATALQKMLEDRETRDALAENAYHRAVECFNFETMGECLLEGPRPALPTTSRWLWRVIGRLGWAWNLAVCSSLRLPHLVRKMLIGHEADGS